MCAVFYMKKWMTDDSSMTAKIDGAVMPIFGGRMDTIYICDDRMTAYYKKNTKKNK